MPPSPRAHFRGFSPRHRGETASDIFLPFPPAVSYLQTSSFSSFPVLSLCLSPFPSGLCGAVRAAAPSSAMLSHCPFGSFHSAPAPAIFQASTPAVSLAPVPDVFLRFLSPPPPDGTLSVRSAGEYRLHQKHIQHGPCADTEQIAPFPHMKQEYGRPGQKLRRPARHTLNTHRL